MGDNPVITCQDDFMSSMDLTILGIEEWTFRISPLGTHTETHKVSTKRYRT